VQGICLDGVDDLANAQPAHQKRHQSEQQAARDRNDQHAFGIDADARAEAVAAGNVEYHFMNEFDRNAQAGRDGANDGAEGGTDEDLGRLVGTQPALHAEKSARLPPGCRPQAIGKPLHRAARVGVQPQPRIQAHIVGHSIEASPFLSRAASVTIDKLTF